MVSAAVAGTTFRPARSYTTLWDVTLGLASTVLPYSYAKEDQAELWVRLLRCEGQVGAALCALGVSPEQVGLLGEASDRGLVAER